MKIKAKKLYSLSPTAFKILSVGLVICLGLSAMGLVGLLLPYTYERIEAANSLLSLALRGLVLTVLTTVVTDLFGKKSD